jgi:hypothetical protein
MFSMSFLMSSSLSCVIVSAVIFLIFAHQLATGLATSIIFFVISLKKISHSAVFSMCVFAEVFGETFPGVFMFAMIVSRFLI